MPIPLIGAVGSLAAGAGGAGAAGGGGLAALLGGGAGGAAGMGGGMGAAGGAAPMGFWQKFQAMYGGGAPGGMQGGMPAPGGAPQGGGAPPSNPFSAKMGQGAQMATAYLDNLENRVGRLSEMYRGPTMPFRPHLDTSQSRPNVNMGNVGLSQLLAQIATRRG